LFADAGEPALTPGTAVALAIAVAAVLFGARTPLARCGAGVLLGGAIGNLGELAVIGHVTDFIPFPRGWLASPADLAIYLGMVLVIGDALRTIIGAVRRRGRSAPTRA
jgi:lipoprotein signal peptidase